MKQRLKSIAESFNAKPLKNDWLQAACDVGLVHRLTVPPSSADTTSADSNPIMADPKSVAEFLKTSPGLGKQQVGEFISKGPAHLFPFHASVLHAYVRTFSYRIGGNWFSFCDEVSLSCLFVSIFGLYVEDIMSFDQALRSFLSSFRLPGEAQCIDRYVTSSLSVFCWYLIAAGLIGLWKLSLEVTMNNWVQASPLRQQMPSSFFLSLPSC